MGTFGKKNAIPGFGDRTFKVTRSVTETILQHSSETTNVEEHSQSFMEKMDSKALCMQSFYGLTYSRKFIGNVVINAKFFIGTNWGKLLQRNLVKFKDPLRFSTTVFIKTAYLVNDLVNYFFKNKGEQICQTTKHFNKEDPAKSFDNNRTTFICKKVLHKNNYEDLALEILEKKAISF